MWFLSFLTIFVLLVNASKTKESTFDKVINNRLHYYKTMTDIYGKKTTDSYDTLHEPSDHEVYDFIVVGSGSAGAVIANRLSENQKWKILLLEVGEEASVITDVPGLAPYFQFTNYNWGYLMEKQENVCLGLIDQRMHWPRGRALGGSTIINYMIHVRGNKLDYDRWAALGNPGWSYEEVLPYFMKSENCTVRRSDPGYRNTSGYLSVQDVPFRSESAHAFVRAAQEIGYKYVDYNGKDQMGVSYVQATQRDGLRCSAEASFLRTAKHRPNLTILTKSRVTKVLIDPVTLNAYGVHYFQKNKQITAKVRKEVILSAGALSSPQLLMLSGIGPKSHLEELGIPLIQNLPVGEKMYDHLTFLGLYFVVNASIVIPSDVMVDVRNYYQFFAERRGPFTTLGGVEALAYFKSHVAEYEENYPDVEFIYIGGGLQSDRRVVYSRMFRVTDEVYERLWRPLEDSNVWTVFPMLLHPKSHGRLKLKSKNPFHWPKFYGDYFTDPENRDVRTFIAAIREVQRIAAAPAFQKYGARQLRMPVPGCEGNAFDTDAYWECALRHVSATLHHQIATCKMGPASDREAVVDSELRVHGIGRLRVADTSVIPVTLSAHTNVPAYMIGEKAADLIKDAWADDV